MNQRGPDPIPSPPGPPVTPPATHAGSIDQPTEPRLAWWRLLADAAGGAAVTTVAIVFLSVRLTPTCDGPWCLTGLLYVPISAIGAAIVALGIAGYARRGPIGYLLGLLAGAAGYAASWYYLMDGGGLRFMA